MKAWGIVGLTFALAGSAGFSIDAAAQAPSVAPMIRGSWITESEGEHYIYIFAVEGNQLSGVVCAKCYDLKNLTFVSDGKIEGDSLSFALIHDTADRKPFRESIRGKYAGGQVTLTVSRENSRRPVELALKRPPSKVAEIFAADKSEHLKVRFDGISQPHKITVVVDFHSVFARNWSPAWLWVFVCA